MASSNLNAETKITAEKSLPRYLKICLVIVAASFLGFSIYWAVRAPFTLYELLSIFSSQFFKEITMGHPFALPLLASQEFAATIGLFINLIAALLVFQGTILFLRNDKKWLKTLSVAMLFEAVWFILLIPTSVHHLVGSVFSMNTANVYVGLSYLVQVLLIAPPLIFLSYNLKSPRNPESTRKWIGLAASLFVFGFWFKYLFLWIDTLSPMGPQQATLMSLVGASNSWLTLLIAGLLAVVASLGFYRTNKVNKWLVGTALVLFGSYFIVYDIVSIWVPIYGSFLYLTDFWMVTLLLIGIAVLAGNRKGIQR